MSAAAPSQASPVSQFAGTLVDILDRVEYRRVNPDDLNDPISDAVRATLDGHISLSRALANRGQFPAIDSLNSVSRLMRQLVPEDDLTTVKQVLKALSVYHSSRDLIDVRAYRPGVTPELDQAVRWAPHLERFLAQAPGAAVSRAQAMQQLRALLTRER